MDVLSKMEAVSKGFAISHAANNSVDRTLDQAIDYARALQNTSSGRDEYAVVDHEGVTPRYIVYVRDKHP